MSLVETTDLVKIYKTKRQGRSTSLKAVDHVSMKLQTGKCTAVVGESGCGKSTLGKMLIGLEKPTAGTVVFEGRKILGIQKDKELRRKIQLVSQNSLDAVNPRFTAEEIISQPLINFFHMKEEDCSKKVEELLVQVGIDPLEKNKYPAQFSGGQLQRICIARALAAEPDLIVLDEPLSSLDVSVQAQILNLLRDLKEEKGLSYFLISHDLEAVYYLADSIYIMYRGQIVEILENLEDFQKLVHPYARRLLTLDTSSYDEITLEEEGKKSTGCSYAKYCAKAKESCWKERPQMKKIRDGHFAACVLQS